MAEENEKKNKKFKYSLNLLHSIQSTLNDITNTNNYSTKALCWKTHSIS